MQILSYPVPLILYLLALVLHFLPCFLPEGWRGKLRYANICFHIAVFAGKFWCKIGIFSKYIIRYKNLCRTIFAGSA